MPKPTRLAAKEKSPHGEEWLNHKEYFHREEKATKQCGSLNKAALRAHKPPPMPQAPLCVQGLRLTYPAQATPPPPPHKCS